MTRAFLLALLYVALAFGANPVLADPLSRESLMALRQGDMRKLALHVEGEKLPVFSLLDMEDGEHSMDEFKGKYVVLNFWATWCAPCREEMPGLNTLQQELGGENFEVVLIAAGRNAKPAIAKFFDKAGIDTLQTLRDPTQGFTNLMGVFGLPATLILSPEGLEIARMRGDAEWHSPEALAFLKAMIAGDGS